MTAPPTTRTQEEQAAAGVSAQANQNNKATTDTGATPNDNNNNKNNNVKKQQLVSIAQLFSFARTQRSKLCIAGSLCFATISGASYPVMAFYFASAFEDLAASTDVDGFMDTIRELAAAFMILGAVMLVAMTLQAFLMETAATEMTMTFKTDWFRALLRQDVAYYDIMDVSGEATIISTNASKYRKGVGRKLAEFVQFGVTFCGGIFYAFWAEWRTSLAVLAVAPFMVLSSLFLIKMNTSVTARANSSYAQAGSIVQTSVSSIRTILALNAVQIMIDRFQEATKEAYKGAVSQVGLLGLANGSSLVSMLLSYVVITLFGTWLLYDQVNEDGCDPSGTVPGAEKCDPAGVDVFGALMGITFAATVLPQISVTLEAFTGARAACYPAFAVMNRKVGQDDAKEHAVKELAIRRGGSQLPQYKIDSSSNAGLKPSVVNGEIEFRNVTFQYPTRQETCVFRDFSLKIEAGKTHALVGFSGSGKSTVVQLIERFYDPTNGEITFDGVPFKALNVKWLRQQIGLVSQEPKLFEWSIRENIAAGSPGATMDEIENAARMANAHDFIMKFPKGYDTAVGDLGSQLSGGQRQRISIARCLVKKPKILLLDEATSALDSESEKAVQKALDDLMKLKSMTIVVIAHRLSTIKNADTIAVVDEGAIIESGTHSELMAEQGHYFKLVEAQQGKDTETQDETQSLSEHSSRQDSMSNPSAHPSETNELGLIEFEDVHFEYPSRPGIEVFRGLNLRVKNGETLALVGPSGCGKSTIIQLIECFYRPTSGVVRYQGIDMSELNVRWLRDELGLVSQEPFLFDCSIEENIKYSLPSATHDQVVDAAKQANAHNFIMEFPDGYATSVGQGSTLVSGGQKQRIAIARALIKKPKVLLLDEATSALDSESESIVQEALDKIMQNRDQTCIVIAHRLSTIRNADRVAVIQHGKVREIGSHDELMEQEEGLYRRLQTLQKLDILPDDEPLQKPLAAENEPEQLEPKKDEGEKKVDEDSDEMEIDNKDIASYTKRAWSLAYQDAFFLFAGAVGAVFAGLLFPGWGFVFAYLIEILYRAVLPCPPLPDNSFVDCDEYWTSEADEMQDDSLDIFYGFIGIMSSSLLGFYLLFWGFGVASERMNRRVRNSAFTSLLRQEVAWFDVRSPGALTSRLSDDAAMMHSFSGEPIRSLVSSIASVLVGVVVSFVYMWPFALLTLGILPFMAFGAATEVSMYWGEDEGDDGEIDENSPGGIVIEALTNIRTVASLTLEEQRATSYEHALEHEVPHPHRNNLLKGGTAGVGQFIQMWGIALMFWWGGWLLYEFPDDYSYREFLISMFALWFSLYGLTIASQNLTDRKKAQHAAARIFALVDRTSLIDPLSNEGITMNEPHSFDNNKVESVEA